MKNKNITEVVEALQSQALQKQDFVVPASCLSYKNGKLVISGMPDNDPLNKLLESTGINTIENDTKIAQFDPMGVFNSQIADSLNIPWQYYQRMTQEGNLPILDHSVNHWLAGKSQSYLVRTFINPETNEGKVRALLSSKYKAIDNWDVLVATLSAINNCGTDVQFEGGDITDSKFIARFVSPSIDIQAPELLSRYRTPNKPDNWGESGIMTGFTITNSEVGNGAFTVSPRIVIRACSNGMIIKSDQIRRTHIGSRLEDFSFVNWSDKTVELNKELILAQVSDTIKTFLSKEWLGKVVADMRESAGIEVIKPTRTIEAVAKDLQFSKDEAEGILEAFLRSNDSTVFGIAQAITFYAQKSEPERQYDLETQATSLVTNSKTLTALAELQKA